ncbi:MAG: hypothetical protein CBC09_06765 [Cellvibrionales bacterium TMED49]|nr:MAG: hypothetical protein CBC09_06765 [Cellvibrionales bacterium TMED49]|tara:strand:+ start:321 stop:581 length:261 start_codon:yes stop_codon:yes gene_type:complete
MEKSISQILNEMIEWSWDIWDEKRGNGRIAIDENDDHGFTKKDVRKVVKAFDGRFFEDDESFHLVLPMDILKAHQGDVFFRPGRPL